MSNLYDQKPTDVVTAHSLIYGIEKAPAKRLYTIDGTEIALKILEVLNEVKEGQAVILSYKKYETSREMFLNQLDIFTKMVQADVQG